MSGPELPGAPSSVPYTFQAVALALVPGPAKWSLKADQVKEGWEETQVVIISHSAQSTRDRTMRIVRKCRVSILLLESNTSKFRALLTQQFSFWQTIVGQTSGLPVGGASGPALEFGKS
jgi:hypothetical protein